MLRKKIIFIILPVVFLFSFITLYGDINREIGFSFIPYETKNLITVNFKKIFKLYEKDDIYKVTFFKNKNFKKILNLFFKAIEDGKINIRKELYFMTVSSAENFDPFNKNYLDNMVIVIRASYKKKPLEKSIIKNVKKIFPRFNFRVRNKGFGRIINFKEKKKSYSVYLVNNQTIIIGNNKNVIRYEEVFSKKKKNVIQNKNFKSSLKMIKHLPILGFYFEFSNFFKNLLNQDDKSFRMDLKNIKDFSGEINSDKIVWTVDINFTSSDKNGNLVTVHGLRKLFAMSAMGGERYIKYTQKINVNEISNGIRIFFTFEVE